MTFTGRPAPPLHEGVDAEVYSHPNKCHSPFQSLPECGFEDFHRAASTTSFVPRCWARVEEVDNCIVSVALQSIPPVFTYRSSLSP